MDDLVFNWRTAILLVMVAQLVLAAGLLWVRRFDFLANRLLAGLLLAVGVTLIPQIIGFAGFYAVYPWLSFAPFQNELLFGPLIWAYAQALTRGRVTMLVWALFVFGAVDFLYHTYWFLQPIETRWDRIGAFHMAYYWPVRTILSVAMVGVGLLQGLRLYSGHRIFMQNQSSAAADFDPRWLPVFLASMSVLFVAWAATEIANSLTDLNYFEMYPFYVLASLAFWSLGQGALILQKEAFPKISHIPHQSENAQRDWTREAESLRARIEKEGWHLEPRLSAPELARRIGTNETYLSRTVNQGAGTNFNRFVNEIRIETVKKGLEGGARDVLALALESGFNSKATFNRVFKDITGETPAGYRSRLATL